MSIILLYYSNALRFARLKYGSQQPILGLEKHGKKLGRDIRIGGSDYLLYLPPREKKRETYIRRYPSLGEGSFERKYVQLYEVDYLEKNNTRGKTESSVSIVPTPCSCQ